MVGGGRRKCVGRASWFTTGVVLRRGEVTPTMPPVGPLPECVPWAVVVAAAGQSEGWVPSVVMEASRADSFADEVTPTIASGGGCGGVWARSRRGCSRVAGRRPPGGRGTARRGVAWRRRGVGAASLWAPAVAWPWLAGGAHVGVDAVVNDRGSLRTRRGHANDTTGGAFTGVRAVGCDRDGGQEKLSWVPLVLTAAERESGFATEVTPTVPLVGAAMVCVPWAE